MEISTRVPMFSPESREENIAVLGVRIFFPAKGKEYAKSLVFPSSRLVDITMNFFLKIVEKLVYISYLFQSFLVLLCLKNYIL